MTALNADTLWMLAGIAMTASVAGLALCFCLLERSRADDLRIRSDITAFLNDLVAKREQAVPEGRRLVD